MKLTYLEKLFLSSLMALSDASGRINVSVSFLEDQLNLKASIGLSRIPAIPHMSDLVEKVCSGVYQINQKNICALEICFTKQEYEEFHHKLWGALSHDEFIFKQNEKQTKKQKEENEAALIAERWRQRDEEDRKKKEDERLESERKREEMIKKAKIDQRLEFDSIMSCIAQEIAEKSVHEFPDNFWDYRLNKNHLGKRKMDYFSNLCLLAAEGSEGIFINMDYVIYKDNDPSQFVKNFIYLSLNFDFENQKIKNLLRAYEKNHGLSALDLIYNEAGAYWNRSAENERTNLESLRIFFFKAIVDGEWYFREIGKLMESKPDETPSLSNIIDFHAWKAKKRA
jgi:hypothetical protein